MMKYLAFFIAAVATVDATNTKVSVFEFGKTGTVRRTNSEYPETSVNGVVSFWNALHGISQLQHAGMSVIPDLFRKPESSLVIGISGTKLEDLSSLSALNEVGHMDIAGNHIDSLISNVEYDELPVETLSQVEPKKGVSGIMVKSENAEEVDAQLSKLLSDIQKHAEQNDHSVVVHVVVEKNEEISRRLSRRLEDEQQNEEEEQGENQDDDKEYNAYYGYGYYNQYGDWVTPYKTMFQIQYFNVVTWTSVGLAIALIYTIFLMAYMPLEPDTLLFGESAKLVGDD